MTEPIRLTRDELIERHSKARAVDPDVQAIWDRRNGQGQPIAGQDIDKWSQEVYDSTKAKNEQSMLIPDRPPPSGMD